MFFFSWAANQHIKKISEGSCDAEEKKRLFKIVMSNFCLNLWLIYLIKAALESIIYQQVALRSLTNPNILNYSMYIYEKLFKESIVHLFTPSLKDVLVCFSIEHLSFNRQTDGRTEL